MNSGTRLLKRSRRDLGPGLSVRHRFESMNPAVKLSSKAPNFAHASRFPVLDSRCQDGAGRVGHFRRGMMATCCLPRSQQRLSSYCRVVQKLKRHFSCQIYCSSLFPNVHTACDAVNPRPQHSALASGFAVVKRLGSMSMSAWALEMCSGPGFKRRS